MSIDQQSGGGAFGDTGDMINLDLRGGNTATYCVKEEECATTKFERADEGTLEGDDSVRMIEPYIQNV